MRATSSHAQISASPVTCGEFALFIRTENYFLADFWDPDVRRSEFWKRHAGRPHAGGDEVLRRIGFCWDRRHQWVLGVSWHEADAYCRFVGGRLPWRYELLEQHKGFHPVGVIPEWCGDWFNSKRDGPKVLPEPPLRRRVEGWTEAECAVPEIIGEPIGFRVVREKSARVF